MAMEIDQDLVLRLKKIVTDELPLSQLSDEQLTAEIENIGVFKLCAIPPTICPSDAKRSLSISIF